MDLLYGNVSYGLLLGYWSETTCTKSSDVNSDLKKKKIKQQQPTKQNPDIQWKISMCMNLKYITYQLSASIWMGIYFELLLFQLLQVWQCTAVQLAQLTFMRILLFVRVGIVVILGIVRLSIVYSDKYFNVGTYW